MDQTLGRTFPGAGVYIGAMAELSTRLLDRWMRCWRARPVVSSAWQKGSQPNGTKVIANPSLTPQIFFLLTSSAYSG